MGASSLLREGVNVGTFDTPNFIFLCTLQADILALKAELGGRERCSQEECVEATVNIPLGPVKEKIDKPVSNSSNCRQIVNFCSKSGVTSSNREIRESEMAVDILSKSRISSVASDRNLKSVKAEPVTSARDAAHEEESRLNDAFSKLSNFCARLLPLMQFAFFVYKFSVSS